MCMACSCGFSKGCTSVLTGSGFIAPPCVLCVLSVYFVCTLQFFLIVRINFSEFSDIGIIAKKKKKYVQCFICIHATSMTQFLTKSTKISTHSTKGFFK